MIQSTASFWSVPSAELIDQLRTTADGLTAGEAELSGGSIVDISTVGDEIEKRFEELI